MMVRLAGKAEMGAGDRSEPQSPTDALAHHQESEDGVQKGARPQKASGRNIRIGEAEGDASPL